MKKYFLKSMTDFVVSQNKILEIYKNHLKAPLFERCVYYANFLKQQPILGHFVPCDLEGNVLPVPPRSNDWYFLILVDFSDELIAQWEQYEEAKERVLFKGFKVIGNKDNLFIIQPENGIKFLRILKKNTKLTIEDLFRFGCEIELTDNAAKSLGYE